MYIKQTTVYAIRIISYLASTKKLATSKEICAAMGIPKYYIMKVIKPLEVQGYIKSYRGLKGGFSLNRDAKDITLTEIIDIFENDAKVEVSETNIFGQELKRVNRQLQNTYSGVTIYSLINK